MNLNLVHIDAITTNGHNHLLSVTSSVYTVGRREVECVWSPFLEERGLSEIGSVSTSGKNNWAFDSLGFSAKLVCNTCDLISFLVQASDPGLLNNLYPFWFLLGKLFESLHKSICNGHTRELGIVTSMCSWLGVTTVENGISM